MDKIEQLVSVLKAGKLTLATAESCTGGLLGKRITDVSGASAVYPGGVISYSNSVKHSILGVSQSDLDAFGAVSAPVAEQMAEGVRQTIPADLGVGITGIAGPKSDDTQKPVGLVFIAAANAAQTLVREYHFSGSRDAVRNQSAQAAAALLLELLAQTERPAPEGTNEEL